MDFFRFERLEIWTSAIDITESLDPVAKRAFDKKLFRYSEQLRGAILSVSNNIAEGSGCLSNKEFIVFLGYSRRSIFEIVNILHVFERHGIISEQERLEHYPNLLKLSKQIYSLISTLRN